MENGDREKILRAIRSNVELKRLYDEHVALESRLARYEGRSFLTSAEELDEKRLKQRKLQGVDRMMRLVEADHSREEAVM